MPDIKYDVQKELGVLSEASSGWTKELNLISWNGNTPKYDIRDWSPDGSRMGKGVGLTEAEARNLQKLLNEIFKD